MRAPRVLALSLVVIASAVTVAACSSEETPATPSDPVLAEGQQVYNRLCASCHGRGGGGGMGPKLSGVVENRYPDIADHEAIIRDGRGSMPGFGGGGNGLTDDEITAVARYEREVL